MAKLIVYPNDSESMLKSRHTSDLKVEAGIDEAGRGCLWGPLMAASVIWPQESLWTDEIRAISSKIKDSKKLSAKSRATLESQIRTHAVAWSIGRVEPEEIDTMGMTKSNRLAFERALNGLSVKPDRIIIDGILGLPSVTGIEQYVEAKGDGTYLAIAAASILAKEARDRVVKDMCEADTTLQDKYDLVNSKGYGTAKHRAGIQEHGMHPKHRKLFLRKLLGLEHIVSESAYGFIED